MIIDTHIHICDERYDQDRENMLKNAEKEGVLKFINIGAEIKENTKVAQYERHGVYKSFGIHPHYIDVFDDNEFDKIKNYLKKSKDVVAVGEIGLDFFKNEMPADLQISIFKKMLNLAKDFNLPVIIHSREAHKEVYDILKEFKMPRQGVIHCFTGDKETAQKFIDIGFLLGIGGVVTFPNAGILKETVKYVGIDFFILETDAPYLAPQQVRGKRNEPVYLKYVVKEIAILKQMTEEKVKTATSYNAEKLFSLK